MSRTWKERPLLARLEEIATGNYYEEDIREAIAKIKEQQEEIVDLKEDSGEWGIADVMGKISKRIADMSDAELKRYQDALGIKKLDTPWGTLVYMEHDLLKTRE